MPSAKDSSTSTKPRTQERRVERQSTRIKNAIWHFIFDKVVVTMASTVRAQLKQSAGPDKSGDSIERNAPFITKHR
jgi:hypothetical protein